MADFTNIQKDDCVAKSLPQGVKLKKSKTVVLQSVINAIKEHGRSSMHKEVCGVLVGNLCWDGEPYLLIDARIEGKYADHQAGSVTFTSETWDYIHDELAKKYPDKRIVGWYHTHPGFGIFLSNMDFFIHENFFSIKWQPAYVFDPQAETEGFFFWHNGDLQQEEVTVIHDENPIVKKASVNVGNEKISIVFPEEKTQIENSKCLRRIRAWIVVLLLVVDALLLYRLYTVVVNFIADFREKSSQQSGAIQQLKKQGDQLKKQGDDQVMLFKVFKQEHDDDLRTRGEEQRRDEAKRQQKIDLLGKRVDELQEQIEDLKRTLKDLREADFAMISNLKDELARLKGQCSSTGAGLEEAKDLLQNLSTVFEELRRRISTVESNIEEAARRRDEEEGKAHTSSVQEATVVTEQPDEDEEDSAWLWPWWPWNWF